MWLRSRTQGQEELISSDWWMVEVEESRYIGPQACAAIVPTAHATRIRGRHAGGNMAFKIREVPVRSVYLDNVNPRHDPIDNEPEIIALLMKKESVRPLAEDIAEMGLSPLERMAVIAHPKVKNAYISLEGNRRFCSLKLLLDPAKAPTPADRNAFEEAKASMRAIPKNLEVVVFDTREDGRHWLRLRHGGEQGGRGTRQWKSPQKARFENQGSGSTPNQQALLLIDYARNRNLVSTDQADALRITTLTRFLSNPSFRDALALQDHKSLNVNAPQDQFDSAVRRFLLDSLDGDNTGVNSRTTSEDRKAYADRLRRDKVAPVDRLERPIELDATTGGAVGDTPGARAKRMRDNQSPDKRTYVIPSEFRAHISDKIHKRIYDELKTVNAETNSFAAAYLFRAFIEQTVKVYLKQNKLPLHGDLHVRIGRVADALKQGGMTDDDLKPFRVMASDKHSQYSPDTLGAFVHGGLIPTKSAINRAWDNVENLLAVILNGLK